MSDNALLARVIATSPYAMPRDDALAHIEERRRKLLQPPAPAVSSECEPTPPIPDVVKSPEQFAEDFWTRHPKPSVPAAPKAKKTKPKAKGARPQLRVIDGDKNG